MTNRKFNVVPVKTSIVTADKVVLIDSEDSMKLKQADATAFKGIQGDIGATGPAGSNGTNGTNGIDGNSIVSVILTSGDHSAGTLDTYTITYTDTTTSTFQVYNGANGTGAGDMLKTENLSGLANYETARANLAIIDDVTVQATKTYSSDKIQALHNTQAQAIQNLSGASATFHSSTPTLIPETPTAFLDLTWTNDISSSNSAIFELGTNEVTFKKDGNYNFLNSMIFSRASSGAIVNITFQLYDADTSTILLSASLPLDIPAGTAEVVPMNVLLPITGTTGIDPVRMKVRMQASSVAGTVTMDSFSTILFAQSVVNIADIDAVPTDGSVNAVQSNGVYDFALITPDFWKYSIVRSISNLVTNNSFETDLSDTYLWLGATITRDVSQTYTGTASCKVIANTSGNSGVQCYKASYQKIGSRYTYSVYVKGTSGNNISIYESDSNTNYSTTLTGSWQRIEITFIAVNTSINLIVYTSTTSSTFYIDAVQVEEGTTVAGPFTTTQGNLTVALKNYEGNDATVAKPIKVMIGGVVRTITSGLSFSANAGTNWCNLGGVEMMDKEVDLFYYLAYSSTYGVVPLFGRLPTNNFIGDFSSTNTNEKGTNTGVIAFGFLNSTDPVVNIGRFNAKLGGSAAYFWALPTVSNIINSPVLTGGGLVNNGFNTKAGNSTTFYPDMFSFNEYNIVDQGYNLTLGNPTGIFDNGRKFLLRIKDNGTARTLSYGTQYASGAGTLLTTTTISKKSWMAFEWDSTDSKAYCLASGTQP